MRGTASKPTRPPAIPLRFLRWYCDPFLLEDIEGDLTELFWRRAEVSERRARWLFARDVLVLCRPGIIRNLSYANQTLHRAMLYYHLKTAVRQAMKNKGYSLINFLGLTVGLVSSMLILLWVQDERAMDHTLPTASRTYAVKRNMVQSSGAVITTDWSPYPLAQTLEEQYPEVDHVTAMSWSMESLFRYNDKALYENGRYATKDFFNVFPFDFLAGNPQTALQEVNAVVISESMARRFFGEDWQSTALGKSLKMDQRDEYAITGVFRDPGPHASLQFDWIAPEQAFIQRNPWIKDWRNGGCDIFLTLKGGSDIAPLREHVRNEIIRHTDDKAIERIYLQPFGESYLHGSFENGVPVGGRIQYVRILTAVAIFTLLIACINFMNLATARASIRSREIGVKKVLGAAGSSLRLQFFVESFFHTGIATVAAALMAYAVLPVFNTITGKALVLDFTDPVTWEALGVIVIVTGLVSGSYPALLMPAMKTVNSLKGKRNVAAGGSWVRHGLAAFQFAIAIFLITGTIVVSRQLHFVLNKDLGLDKDNVMLVTMEGGLAGKNKEYRHALEQIPEVSALTFTSGNPISNAMSTGGASWEGKNPDDQIEINVITVDDDFFKTMRAHMAMGSIFSNRYEVDSTHFIVNEVLARIMGFKDPIGKRLDCWGTSGTIIGVVKDFNLSSLYEPIAPLIIRYEPGNTGTALIRTQGSTPRAIADIEQATRKLNPDFPFRYRFMNEAYNANYQNEMTVSMLLDIFAVVCIFVACLGLLGLSSFSADQRSKEVGIRRVHGAGIANLVLLLTREYVLLMIIAFGVTVPFAWFYMHRWLETFAFRTTLSADFFLLAGVIAFALGAITVGIKSLLAARANPIKVLREE